MKKTLALAELVLICFLYVKADEEEIRVVFDCPYFDFNMQVPILDQETDFDKQTKISGAYIKRFIDGNDLFDIVLSAIPDNEVDKLHKNREKAIKVFHASAVWVPEKQLFLVSARVWVFEWTCYIYTTFFDENWKEVKDEAWIGATKVPSLLNIPNDWSIPNSGPEDGRLFRALSGHFFIIFNMKRKNPPSRPTFLYSYTTGTYRQLVIPEQYDQKVLIEKNWSPLIIDDSHIYFIYNFENFQVIDCTDESPCTRVAGKFQREPGILRGGTAFKQFKNTNYYFSLGFTHLEYTKNGWCKLYRPALVLIKAKYPDFELLYTSEPIDFMFKVTLEPVTKYKTPGERVFCGAGGWLIPNSIAKIDENDDIADITLSVDDEQQLVVKAKGLLKYISKIIEAYEKELLPEEQKCAEKFAYDYYEQKELVSPIKGLEEKDFEKSEAIESKGSCMEKHYLNFQSNKCEKCFEECAECEIYDYCTKCRDENAEAKGGYCLCKEGFYMDEKNNRCKACSKNCLACASADSCLKCKTPNSVSDDGFCKCLEGFIEVYNSNEHSCEDPSTYDNKYGCYRGHSGINKNEYLNLFSSNFGYYISPDENSLSMILSGISPAIATQSKEAYYCHFEMAEGNVQKIETSSIKGGYLIDLEVKITKL